MTRGLRARLTKRSFHEANMNQSRCASDGQDNTPARVRNSAVLRLHAVWAAAAILVLAGIVAQAPTASASPDRTARPAQPKLTGVRTAAGSLSSSPAAQSPHHARPLLRMPGSPGAGTPSGDDARFAEGARADSSDGPAGRAIAVGAGPYGVAIDQATDTAYVAANNTLSVINTATCNAAVRSGCGQAPPTVTGLTEAGPVDAVDQATDTVYVVNGGSDTVSVINGATCNGRVSTGCGQTPATITVGDGPDGIAVDQATDTVYVANDGPGLDNSGHTVSVINGATCNGQVRSGCGQAPATVQVGLAPAVDQATDTVYVPNSSADTVSVIDGMTCNATVTTGCGHTPPAVVVGPNAASAAVDQATDTVYVTVAPGAGTSATNLGLVAVINGATCNATVTSGCGQAPATVTVGSIPIGVVVDPVTQSVFVVNEEDSTVSVIDGAKCNAVRTAGCSQRPPDVATEFNPGYLDVDPATGTLYVSNQDENTVSVLDAGACTLTRQSGCRHAAPATTVGTGPMGIAVDQQTGTVYAANQNDNDLSVISGAICNASVLSGCGRSWPTVTTQAVAVDQRTDTVYVANLGDNTVSVIDGATCNATHHSGCGLSPPAIAVGGGPDGVAVNQATDTIYVVTGLFAFTPTAPMSVIDGATCDATVTSGCGQLPATMVTGGFSFGVAVNQATDTVFASSIVDSNLEMFEGATCNAAHHSGCGQNPAAMPSGGWPGNIALYPATRTVYVTDNVDGEVSVFASAAK